MTSFPPVWEIPGPPGFMSLTDFTNRELIRKLKFELTHGAFTYDVETHANFAASPEFLAATAPWRRQLWLIANEIDARLNPTASNGGPR